MPELVVDLYGHRLGTLVGERSRFDFAADPEAIRRYGAASTVLSFAIPLVPALRGSEVGLRRTFFEEILAEGTAREQLSRNARLDEDNTMALLRRYGRDVAGALQIWDPSDPLEPRVPTLAPISPQGITQLLAEVRQFPLGNATARRMSSLAGVQDKIVLARTADGWAEPLDGYPSTHIIKPLVATLPTLIFDEEYGSRIARHLGLAAFDTHTERFDDITALVIERYDRGPAGRIHQEDFNQALGMRGDAKYEAHGHPGLAAIARTLDDNIGRRAVRSLLAMTTLSVAIGNLDMHAKNISVLHLPDGTAELAPMYDVVPQMHQPFDPEFAFAIDGVTTHNRITLEGLVREGTQWGLRDAAALVSDTVEQIAAFVTESRPLPGAHHSLAEDIGRFCENLLSGRGASKGHGTPSRGALRQLPESDGGWGGPGRR